MITDTRNRLQKNFDVLQDICTRRVEMANFILSFKNEDDDFEDWEYYTNQISTYKLYDV
jgi:hypothetical protein